MNRNAQWGYRNPRYVMEPYPNLCESDTPDFYLHVLQLFIRIGLVCLLSLGSLFQLIDQQRCHTTRTPLGAQLRRNSNESFCSLRVWRRFYKVLSFLT